MYHCYWLTWTHVPSYAYTYRIVQNSSTGKLWRIWRIWSNSPKFYTPKFASLWLPKKSRSKNLHDVYLEMLSSYEVEATEEVLMNYTAYTYYIMLIAKCRCAWLHHPLKLLPSAFCHVLIQVSQDGFMLRLICVFLGCDLPIQLLLKFLSREYDDRLIDPFIV